VCGVRVKVLKSNVLFYIIIGEVSVVSNKL
jgi:hypothetical protein